MLEWHWWWILVITFVIFLVLRCCCRCSKSTNEEEEEISNNNNSNSNNNTYMNNIINNNMLNMFNINNNNNINNINNSPMSSANPLSLQGADNNSGYTGWHVHDHPTQGSTSPPLYVDSPGGQTYIPSTTQNQNYALPTSTPSANVRMAPPSYEESLYM